PQLFKISSYSFTINPFLFYTFTIHSFFYFHYYSVFLGLKVSHEICYLNFTFLTQNSFVFEILSLKEQQLFKRFAIFGTLGLISSICANLKIFQINKK
ncbi:hypothetical protein BpHYR1_024083, partial [Brachionus plicatilis]